MKNTICLGSAIHIIIFAMLLGVTPRTDAEPLLNFPFNEGSGDTTTDTASGLTGEFGIQQDPVVDFVQLIDASPSGLAGDRSITNSGAGFLLADDTDEQVLNITDGPITLETWIYIDPFTPAGTAEGILAYGNSYKMGMRSGMQVFTLYGIVDVVNNAAGPVPAGEWVHLAAAWDPGVGVHFFVNGVESFEAEPSTAARPIRHSYLSIASEGFGNNSVAAFDRMRIHHALLTDAEIDSVAETPKAPLDSTLVSYDFNEDAFPAMNAVEPSLPTMLSAEILPSLTGPDWTNDTPTGAPGDHALAFLTENPPIKEVVTVEYGSTVIDLGADNTSYTLQAWVKLPTGPMEERRVIYRQNGPAPRISLSINADRTMHTTILGTADFTSSVRVPNDDRWHHLAVVMENFDQLHFYLDGVLRQTRTRTQTGTPSSGGSAQLLIGKESETRFFRGLLDRVIINNDALAADALDYPAVPGLATFDTFESHPADVMADAGSSVNFTAVPTSPTGATYQWHYRGDLADQDGVPIEGATATTLTLDNVTAADEGFYSLLVNNEAGETESYRAQLILRESLFVEGIDFEAPTYTSGPIDGQEFWVTEQNQETARVLTAAELVAVMEATGRTPGETVKSGDQALLVSGPQVSSATVRPITGYETATQVTLEFWARPLGAGTAGNAIGNTFLAIEGPGGASERSVLIGFRLADGAQTIDYGSQGAWQRSGLTWEEDAWYHFTLNIDFAAGSYVLFINGEEVVSDVPFWEATTTQLGQLRIFRGSNQAGVILDDVMLSGTTVTEPAREIFWSDTGGFVESQGSVWSSGYDGSGKTAIATGLTRPLGVALDAGNGHVYWAEDGFESQPSRIVRANLDGSDQTVLFSEEVEGFTNAQMLALDLAGGHVYWTDYFLGVIRGNLDGTGYTVLGGSGAQFTALDLDLVNGHIYYGDPTQFGVLFRMDLDGGNDIEIVRDLAADHWRFNSISLDVANGHIYYTDAGTHDIKRMDLDGSNQTVILTDPELNPFGIALGPDDSLYWVGGLGQRLGTANKDGVSDVNLELVSLNSTTAFGIDVLVPAEPGPPMYATDFEAPAFTSGPVAGQDLWTNNRNDDAVRVLTGSEIGAFLEGTGRIAGQTVQRGDQALLISGSDASTTTIRAVSGFEGEDQVVVDVWARPLGATEENPIGNVFFALESSEGSSGRAALIGFRLVDDMQTIDYGTAVEGTWQRSGVTWEENTWYHLTVRLDYSARTYDLSVDGMTVASNVPFVHDADSLHQIRIFRGSNQAGMIVDDLSVEAGSDQGSGFHISEITRGDSTVTVTWEGGEPPYQLQRRENVAEGAWEDVGGPTNATTATDTTSAETMFYRVLGN